MTAHDTTVIDHEPVEEGDMRRWLIGNRFMVTLALTLLLSFAAAGQAAAKAVELDIEVQPLAESLKSVAEVFNLQIAFFPEDTEDIQAPALAGYYTADTAFTKLLSNTPLEHRFIDDDSVAIGRKQVVNDDNGPKASAGAANDDSGQGADPEGGRDRDSGDSGGTDEGNPQAFEQDEQATQPGESTNEVAPTDDKRLTGRMFSGEIVVSAQKREQNIQDVPISITAFGADQLEHQNIVGLEDLAKATPNLDYVSDGTLKNTAPSIRGVFSPYADNAGLDLPVAMYVDEVYIGGSVGQDFELYDIERVEVLRGPQGTLFGRNALSGLINVVTRLPSDTLEGYGEVVVGNESLTRVRAGISGPLVEDRLLASISATYLSRGGYDYNRATGNDVNDAGNWAVRGKFVYRFNDRSRAILSLQHREVDQVTRTYDIAGYNGSPGTLFQPWGPAEVDTDPFDRTISQDYEGQETLDETGAALTFDVDLDGMAFKSISSFRTHDYFQSYDADNTEIPLTIREKADDLDAYSQELRLTSEVDGSPFDWIVGAIYYHQKTVNEFASLLNNETLVDERLLSVLLPPESVGLTPELLALFGLQDTLDFFVNGIPALGIPPLLALPFGETRSIGETELDSIAGYLHGVWHATDRLNVEVGLRYTTETKDFHYVQSSAPGNQFFGLPQLGPIVRDDSWDALTPSLGVDYKATENVLFYGKIANGFKSGGFNDSFGSEAETSYDEETMWNYEVGAKTTLWDSRIQLNAAGFYMDWKDRQTEYSVLPPGAFIPVYLFDTAGDVGIAGVEIEAFILPVSGLYISAALGLIDAEYTAVSPRFAALGAEKGTKLEAVPSQTVNLGIEYTAPLGSGGTLTFDGHLNHRGSTPLTVIQTGVPNEQKAYGLIDAGITWWNRTGVWSVQLWGKNLTDEIYVTRMFNVDGAESSPIRAVYQSLGPPRTFGLKIRRVF